MALASNVSDWHAYDRVIRGIANYNSTHRGVSITLDIIGAGTAIDKLTQLTKTLGQEDAINFVGPIEEEQIIAHLSQHYDLAFSTLGMHRKGVDYDSSMKSRDFCLAGLPFVLAADDFSFPKEKPYWMYAPQNDSAIDMELCLAFFNDLKIQHPHYHTEMTQYALTALGWDNCFAGIIAKIKAIKNRRYRESVFLRFVIITPQLRQLEVCAPIMW